MPQPDATGASQHGPSVGQWAVGLIGGDSELGEIAPHLGGPVSVQRLADGWELTSERFGAFSEAADVRTAAEELVQLLNGLARVQLDAPDPIAVGNVRRYRPGGRKDVWVFPESISVRLRVGTPTIAIDGVPVKPASWMPELALAEGDERVRAALLYLALPPTWHGLFAALEVVVGDPRTNGRHGVRRWANVAGSELSRFTATANSYRAIGVQARHGPKFHPPAQPMALPDATELIRRIVRLWLQQLRQVERSAS